jgi:chromosomal replication initiator protein
VISSDKAPKEIENLEDRIKSRLEWGLPVDIQSPDYETRMAILRKRADNDNLNIPDEVIQYIATNIVSNIRELEGALNKISVFSKLDNTPITVEFAQETLKDLISKTDVREITPSLITDVVSEHLSIPKEDILSSKRSADIALARQISMYLCRTMTERPLESIGDYFKKDHTTVMHAVEKIKSNIQTNDNLNNTVETIIKKINPS